MAVPKYFDLETKANANVLTRLAAQIESGSAVNYAHNKSGVSGSSTIISTTDCSDAINNVLTSGALPSGYTTTGTVGGSGADTGSCVITQTSTSNTATVTIYKTSTS